MVSGGENGVCRRKGVLRREECTEKKCPQNKSVCLRKRKRLSGAGKAVWSRKGYLEQKRLSGAGKINWSRK